MPRSGVYTLFKTEKYTGILFSIFLEILSFRNEQFQFGDIS